jgi:hypothetical protein
MLGFEVGGADGEWFVAVGAAGALFGADDVGFMVGEFDRWSDNRPQLLAYGNLRAQVLTDARCLGPAGDGLVVCFSNWDPSCGRKSGLATLSSIFHRRWLNVGFEGPDLDPTEVPAKREGRVTSRGANGERWSWGMNRYLT